MAQGAKPGSSNDGALNPYAIQSEAIFFANFDRLLHHLLLSVLQYAERLVGFGELLHRCPIARECPFTVGNDLGLSFQENARGFLASCLSFGDWPLVAIEQRKSARESDREEVVPFLVGIAGPDLDVGVLLGNFKLQVRFSCRVLCQGPSHIQAIQNGISLDMPRREGLKTRRRLQGGPREIKAL